MKPFIFLPILALPVLVVSCAQSSSTGDYDVSNPYAAPEYGDNGAVTPSAQANVNPPYNAPANNSPAAYDAPAVYEEPAATTSTSSSKVHTVVRGDTLWGLSKEYGVSVDSIKQANGLTSDVAVLGANLQIPAQ
ncbi:MAG: LysM peptidoglycan-binding domain-containing protein [Luteolibacter sp.]